MIGIVITRRFLWQQGSLRCYWERGSDAFFQSYMKKEADLQRLSNEYVLKMIESMRRYQDFAIAQGVRRKDRYNVRVRQPLEFVECIQGGTEVFECDEAGVGVQV